MSPPGFPLQIIIAKKDLESVCKTYSSLSKIHLMTPIRQTLRKQRFICPSTASLPLAQSVQMTVTSLLFLLV